MAEEIQKRISAENRYYFSLQGIFKCKHINRATKIHLYKTVLKPVVMYGSEIWAMTVTEEEWLHRWERKVLTRIFSAENVQGTWKIRTNAEIQQIYGEPDIVIDMKKSKLKFISYTIRISCSSVCLLYTSRCV